MKDSKKMTTLLQVRLDVEESARLHGLARAEGLTTSAYIRKLALGSPHPNTCSAWDAAKLATRPASSSRRTSSSSTTTRTARLSCAP